MEAQALITFPGESFSDITFQRGGLASTSVIYERTSIGSASFTFTTGSSSGIVGMNQIGTLRLSTALTTNSAFARIHVSSLNITPVDPAAQPTLLGSDGQIVIAAQHPLLEAHMTPTGRELTLYGLPGNFQLEVNTNFLENIWRRRAIVAIPSNYFRLVPIGNNPTTNVPAIFRLR
jgi:hypothetical protein